MINEYVKRVLPSIVFLFFVCSQAFSFPEIKPGVNIVGGEAGWLKGQSFDLETLQAYGTSLKASDPNFQKEGVTQFTGIRLETLVQLAGIPLDQGLTIIGRDQYVGYLPRDLLTVNGPIMAWLEKDTSISPLRGGPLKIMFPENAGVHGSCYTWYVDTLVVDTFKTASLTIEAGGRKKYYSQEQLTSMAEPLDPGLFSIPHGCRNEFWDREGSKTIQAVPMARLVKGEILGKASVVRLIPYAGMAISLAPAVVDYPVYIVVSSGGRLLHPAQGGPLSVIFPLEAHPGLNGLVPETGAFFFLEKISVE